jgi:hypothetical protein
MDSRERKRKILRRTTQKKKKKIRWKHTQQPKNNQTEILSSVPDSSRPIQQQQHKGKVNVISRTRERHQTDWNNSYMPYGGSQKNEGRRFNNKV